MGKGSEIIVILYRTIVAISAEQKHPNNSVSFGLGISLWFLEISIHAFIIWPLIGHTVHVCTVCGDLVFSMVSDYKYGQGTIDFREMLLETLL